MRKKFVYLLREEITGCEDTVVGIYSTIENAKKDLVDFIRHFDNSVDELSDEGVLRMYELCYEIQTMVIDQHWNEI
jgi:hypothetical protein